ncbi:9347_t:CDS:2 [Cetraspora pellucida]|uniref:9347_t:CDS:1 n=1 Tax=Cetraspora pellucida TaxID=1433469 RepID=A0A9N9HGG6_9GLOM|nr:9347_t:CDS:2 [Cetraspora pellucida]
MKEPILGIALTEQIVEILPINYLFIVNELHELDPLITDENIKINQIVGLFFVNINSVKNAHVWFEDC